MDFLADISGDSVVAAATVILVIVTAIYAWQTRETVRLLREEMEGEVARVRHALLGELTTIRNLVGDGRRQESVAVVLPDSSWREAQRHSAAVSSDLSLKLFDTYQLVYRLNATCHELLMGWTAGKPRQALNERRVALLEELRPRVLEVEDLLRTHLGLPSIDEDMIPVSGSDKAEAASNDDPSALRQKT